DFDTFADGILAGPVSHRQKFVNHDNGRRVFLIERSKTSAAHNRNAHGFEEPFIDDVVHDVVLRPVFGILVTLASDVDAETSLVDSKRHYRTHCHRLHAGSGTGFLEQAAVKLLDLRITVANESWIEAHRHQMIGAQSGAASVLA